MTVTDKDRLAAYTLDALIGTRFNTQSDPQIVAWCEQYVAQARAEGRAEEREACAAWHESEADGAMLGPLDAYPAGVTPIEYAGLIVFHRRAARAIRARGEKGED